MRYYYRSTCTVALLVLAVSPAAASEQPEAAAQPTRDVLQAQARRCRQILQTSIVDFYLPACVDATNGGYLESLQGNQFAPAGEKFLTLQARQLWFFSTLARIHKDTGNSRVTDPDIFLKSAAGSEKGSALAVAKTGFAFLEAKFRDRAHGGYFAKVSAEGRPTDRRKHVYLNAFALYALAAYYRASDDAAALAAAKNLFLTLDAKCHDAANGGYHEFFQEDWRPIANPQEPSFIGPPGTKTFNTHLHVLEAFTELYRVWPDAQVRRRLDELLLINMSTIRLPQHGCNVDGFTPDWKPIETARNLRASYGHDVEAVWLCLDAARALGHQPALLRGWAEGLVGYSLQHGYDRTHGGFYYTGPLGKDADESKKEWWVEAEALVSMLELYKLTGRRRYYDVFAQTLDFVEKHQVAKQGSWWATRQADGSPAGTSRTSMWQGAYHNGRSMLLCARLLDELAAATKAPGTPLKPVGAAAMPLALHVDKTRLVTTRNERVRLRGVNAASLEWTSDGEGHILETIKVAIKDWHVNVIRLPLSQDRWFGKAPEQKDDGKAYRAVVKQCVEACAANSCYVILDLHWSNAGEWGKNIGQHVMPDKNSLLFWKDLAVTYKNHPAVLFDLYNEPHDVSWDVWLKGGTVTERCKSLRTELTFEAVGMQTLLDTVRQTGAHNIVVAGGLDWAYDMSGFLAGKQLSDPRGNGVIYANHAYPNKGDTVEKWVAKMVAAAKAMPIIVAEFGTEATGPSSAGPRAEQWVRDMLGALHDHDWDWIAWDLHAHAGPRLISDWKYTPTPAFGALVKEALTEQFPPKEPPCSATTAEDADTKLGILAGHGDIGTVLHPGSVKFDETAKTYTVSGSGANMWSTTDAFHFAWTKVTGDAALAADIAFVGKGIEPHRKACLLIRQSLNADSAYVDVALHGDGLTSLQFRDAKGAATHEVQANVSAPQRLQLVKRGKYALMYLAAQGHELRYSGAAVRLALVEPYYVGIGVCAHNKDVTETAVFSKVELTTPLPALSKPPALYSILETQMLPSMDRRVVHVTPGRIEAPNWLKDGKTLIYNAGGRVYRIPDTGGKPETIDTGFAARCNNDHGVSPDGTLLVISDQSQGDRKSRIYTLPITGGTPRLITPNGPSYWHGWSPDGKTLAYCAERNGEFGIYTIPAGGGAETRLTTTNGLDDGPEFSPDGKHIYFNSDRTGRMQLWRMKPDGTDPEQLTDDDYNNWFPHPSPDGRTLVFLSYDKNVTGHPPDKDVTLRRLALVDKKIAVLGHFLGGQGTINVPCWSPDGRRIAFVTYQLIP